MELIKQRFARLKEAASLRLWKTKNFFVQLRSSLKVLPSSIMFAAKNLPHILAGEVAIAYVTLSAKKISADGRITDYGVVCRKKVTQEFVKHIAYSLDGDVGTSDAKFLRFQQYKYHDSGTGGDGNPANEVNSSTALTTPTGIARATGTQVDSSSGSTGGYTSVGEITYNATFAIREHGLFNAASGTDELMDRSQFSDINVVNTDKIQFTYVLTINPEA